MPLEDRIRARIEAGGPITFADFMEAALYDPDEGFYSRPRVGADRDYVTSPHVSPAFGALVARQLAECWEHLGRPRPFRVAEVGAGDGTLARRLLEEAAAVPELSDALAYAAVERGPAVLGTLEAAGIPAHRSLAEVAPVHCVLANEVLDNLPFHRLRGRAGRTVEVFVGAEGGSLVEVEGRPSAAALAALREPPRDGEERSVSPGALAFVREVAAALPRGYAFLFDYGFGAGEAPGEVHGYVAHRVTGDVLSDPGSRDVTAAVDLAAVAAEAGVAGLTAWGPVSQREALLGLGMRLWLAGLRRRRAEAEERGGHQEATRLWGEISRASILIDASKLGGLRLLALGTEGLPAPAAALGDRAAGC